MNRERYKVNADCREAFEWDKWQKEIPFLDFKPEWLVKPVPPFSGAVARFYVKHKDAPESHVSVYLDCYEELGYFGEPYWEIYPDSEDNNIRFAMTETAELLQAIEESLLAQLTPPLRGEE